jgi:O-antigen/teichoic acid export membrane protein
MLPNVAKIQHKKNDDQKRGKISKSFQIIIIIIIIFRM